MPNQLRRMSPRPEVCGLNGLDLDRLLDNLLSNLLHGLLNWPSPGGPATRGKSNLKLTLGHGHPENGLMSVSQVLEVGDGLTNGGRGATLRDLREI